ncbi:hypothetical protein [Embleya hyalina]|uniref:Uncharacterized protein n=1 Tax=Embleya hyalina TaxID=516124 RepID=A0A401YQN4_9ACTN|nr:hypothetical protein [Embleya hyalina]GCD96901.1 hypothetical protein EHYA_04588 [Embleya hyalina]
MDTDPVVPAWPIVHIELLSDDVVRVDGEEIAVPPGDSARQAALAKAAETARLLRRPVRAEAVEPNGTTFPLIVAADATVTEAGEPSPAPAARRRLLGRSRSAPAKKAPSRPSAPVPTIPPAPEPDQRNNAAPALGIPTPPTPAHPIEIPHDRQPGRPHTAAKNTSPVAPVAPPTPRHSPAITHPEDEPEAFTAPGTHASERVAQVARAVQAGDLDEAMALAVSWETDQEATATPDTSGLAREVQAYVTLLTGRPEVAVGLFVSAITMRKSTPGDTEAIRLADNALYSWLQVPDHRSRTDLGELVLSAYATTTPGHPAEQFIRGHMA